jgi:hypothetical protein
MTRPEARNQPCPRGSERRDQGAVATSALIGGRRPLWVRMGRRPRAFEVDHLEFRVHPGGPDPAPGGDVGGRLRRQRAPTGGVRTWPRSWPQRRCLGEGNAADSPAVKPVRSARLPKPGPGLGPTRSSPGGPAAAEMFGTRQRRIALLAGSHDASATPSSRTGRALGMMPGRFRRLVMERGGPNPRAADDGSSAFVGASARALRRRPAQTSETARHRTHWVGGGKRLGTTTAIKRDARPTRRSCQDSAARRGQTPP